MSNNYDTTGLDAIRDLDFAAADAFHVGTHPQGFSETAGSLVELLDRQGSATSGSSVTIGTGEKVFTLDSIRDWTNGVPVYITDDLNPSNNVMVGTLSADESAGVITVEVSSTKGSGTFTTWTISLILAAGTVIATPVSLADGAFGADMAANSEVGRANVEVGRFLQVAGIFASPVVAETVLGSAVVQRVLVDDEGTIGVFIGQEDKIATLTAPETWSFSLPDDGTLIWNMDGGAFTGHRMLVANSLTPNSLTTLTYEDLTNPRPRVFIFGINAADTIEFTAENPAQDIVIDRATAYILTIEPRVGAGLSGALYTVWRNGVGTVTINIASGGDINGVVGSVSIPNQYDSIRLVERSAGSFIATQQSAAVP